MLADDPAPPSEAEVEATPGTPSGSTQLALSSGASAAQGNGMMVDASYTGAYVRIDSMYQPGGLIGAVRPAG